MAAGNGEVTSCPGRCDHTTFIEGNILYVWGGWESVCGSELMLPSNEIWLFDLDTALWERKEMSGDIPPPLSGFCGSYHKGTFYVFGGCEPTGHSNTMYTVDMTTRCYPWRTVSYAGGDPPSPRDRHSCWIHRDRLIYFGGYGCKTTLEATNSESFTVDETSWTEIGNTFFRFWGWNNEVAVFDTRTSAWSKPETQGPAPSPRSSHASATLGSKGYVCGGLEAKLLDLHCLDLNSWTWTSIDVPSGAPMGRSMHSLTPSSDNSLFLFGGLATNGEPLSDGWEFDAQTREWKARKHPHHYKPRLWHSACQGADNDVIVFGGSNDFSIRMDSAIVLRSPCHNHSKDVLIFQNQLSSLLRLCEDAIARNVDILRGHLAFLPPKLQERVNKRVSFISNSPKPKEIKLIEMVLELNEPVG